MRALRHWTFLFTVVLLLSMTARMPAAAQRDNILHIVSFADIRTTDPHIAYEFETWPAASLFYRGLITMNGDTPEPALAESWTISEDGTVYTFTLRDGVKFSNGRQITAEDVKYSFERLLNPELPSPTYFFFDTLVGVPEYRNGEADEVTGIRIVDDRTVEFTFTVPNWTMMKRFGLPPGFIVAREGVEAAGEEFARQPLGAGPFVLDSWESGVRMTGSRNPNYWREGYPIVDGFTLDIGVDQSVGILRVESGEADVTYYAVPNSDYPRLAADPVLSEQLFALAAFPNTDYVTINTHIEPFNNLDVRRALDMAIDRNRLSQINNNRAIIANGMLPPSMSGDNKSLAPTEYNPEKAKELLAQAGYPDGFTMTFMSSTDSQQQSVAQALKADWAAIGVEADYTAYDPGQYVDLLVNQPDQIQTALVQWWNDYLDPSNSYEPLLKCGGTYNWGRYCNEELDQEFEAAHALAPGDDRWNAFAQLEADIQNDVPNLYLYHLQSFFFRGAGIEIESDAAFLLRFDEARVQ